MSRWLWVWAAVARTPKPRHAWDPKDSGPPSWCSAWREPQAPRPLLVSPSDLPSSLLTCLLAAPAVGYGVSFPLSPHKLSMS